MGSISRDIVNFPSELCRRRRSGLFTEVARLVPPEGSLVHVARCGTGAPQVGEPVDLCRDARGEGAYSVPGDR